MPDLYSLIQKFKIKNKNLNYQQIIKAKPISYLIISNKIL